MKRPDFSGRFFVRYNNLSNFNVATIILVINFSLFRRTLQHSFRTCDSSLEDLMICS